MKIKEEGEGKEPSAEKLHLKEESYSIVCMWWRCTCKPSNISFFSFTWKERKREMLAVTSQICRQTSSHLGILFGLEVTFHSRFFSLFYSCYMCVLLYPQGSSLVINFRLNGPRSLDRLLLSSSRYFIHYKSHAGNYFLIFQLWNESSLVIHWIFYFPSHQFFAILTNFLINSLIYLFTFELRSVTLPPHLAQHLILQ